VATASTLFRLPPEMTMSMPRLTQRQDTQPAGARPVEALGTQHRIYLASAIAATAPDWSVELYDEALGPSTIIIMPEAADDEIGPTYFVHLEDAAFCLDQLHWDSYSSVGRFSDLHDVARALRTRLLCLATMTTPGSLTVH